MLHTGLYSLANATALRAVHDWLGVVAKYVSFDECVGVASEALLYGQ